MIKAEKMYFHRVVLIILMLVFSLAGSQTLAKSGRGSSGNISQSGSSSSSSVSSSSSSSNSSSSSDVNVKQENEVKIDVDVNKEKNHDYEHKNKYIKEIVYTKRLPATGLGWGPILILLGVSAVAALIFRKIYLRKFNHHFI